MKDIDVAELNFSGVPGDLRQYSHQLETIESGPSEVVSVPGLLGWNAHVGLRQDDAPLRTHVCSSSYDHINIDASPEKVRKLYDIYPQLDSIISLVGMPGVPSLPEVKQLLDEWGASSSNPIGTIPSLTPGDVYAASPVFVLHRVDQAHDPLAICACRFEVSNPYSTTVQVDATLDWVAVRPQVQNEGLGLLLLLEAARWLGMLTRSMKIRDDRFHSLIQRVIATPKTKEQYHLAQVFGSNFNFFCVTEELAENTRQERLDGSAQRGSVRAGFGTISEYTPLEDAIYIPDDVLLLDELEMQMDGVGCTDRIH